MRGAMSRDPIDMRLACSRCVHVALCSSPAQALGTTTDMIAARRITAPQTIVSDDCDRHDRRRRASIATSPRRSSRRLDDRRDYRTSATDRGDVALAIAATTSDRGLALLQRPLLGAAALSRPRMLGSPSLSRRALSRRGARLLRLLLSALSLPRPAAVRCKRQRDHHTPAVLIRHPLAQRARPARRDRRAGACAGGTRSSKRGCADIAYRPQAAACMNLEELRDASDGAGSPAADADRRAPGAQPAESPRPSARRVGRRAISIASATC